MPLIPQDGDDSIVAPRPVTAVEKRYRIVARGLRYYAFRQQILYSQARPTQIRLPRETTRLDCSGLVACCMDFAGVLPKVDWRYTNTWVQIQFGKVAASPKPGDVVFYGHGGNPTHEALYLGTREQLDAIGIEPPAVMKNGKWVLSDGHYPMGVYPVDYRSDRIQTRSFL